MTGKLVIVPTPLGNLGDVSRRVREALGQADAILAEDTRVTGRLLNALDLQGLRLERLDENLMGQRSHAIIERVKEGETLAYCSDAGMPGVSDPGLRLVRAAREADVPVEVLPGPSAAVTAYVASGTLCPRFYFGGFFPRKDAQRQQLLKTLAPLDAALVFYESPNRLVSALDCIARMLPQREVAVCRELTKLHEEVVRGTTSQVKDEFSSRENVRGEVALVIDAPNEAEAHAAADEATQVAAQSAQQLLDQGLRPRQVAQQVAQTFGIPRNKAYELVISLRDKR